MPLIKQFMKFQKIRARNTKAKLSIDIQWKKSELYKMITLLKVEVANGNF